VILAGHPLCSGTIRIYVPLNLSGSRNNNVGMTANLRSFVPPGLLIVLILLCAGCMQGQEPSITDPAGNISSPVILSPVTQIATKEALVSFVREAVAYARINGKEKALQEFSNRNGSFFRGELYIYAYDVNGTTIAHPVNPEKIGVSRINEKDAEGNFFIRDLRAAATDGSGFVTYYYVNPSHNNTVEKKLGYAMAVDSTWWLGSGIYQGPADTPVAPATEPAPAVTTPQQGN
jgi:cytochrome c